MKIKLLVTFAVAFYLFACNKEMEKPQSPIDKKETTTSPSFTQYNILKGKQYCDKSNLIPVKFNLLSFKVKFDSSAIYRTRKAENQKDINKLFGFSDNNALHHEYSARFGWRWSDNALRIFAYDYNKGTRSYKELGTVEIGKENDCSISISDDTYIFNLNGIKMIMPRASTTLVAEGYQLYPYFGGDEAAPHNISIWIKIIS